MKTSNRTNFFPRAICILVAACGLLSTMKMGAGERSVSPDRCIRNWWRAEANASDMVGGQNGILKNGAGYADGMVGLAFNFNQCANNYVEATHDDTLNFGTGDFTIETWVNFRSWNPSGSYDQPDAIFIGVDEGSGETSKWFFAIHANMLTFHINSPTLGPKWMVDAPFAPEINQWYHLAVTRKNGVFTMYVNGLAIGNQASFDAVPAPNAPLTIGQCEGLGFIDGLMDETTIYTCALSPAEIQAIYGAGSKGKRPTGKSIRANQGQILKTGPKAV